VVSERGGPRPRSTQFGCRGFAYLSHRDASKESNGSARLDSRRPRSIEATTETSFTRSFVRRRLVMVLPPAPTMRSPCTDEANDPPALIQHDERGKVRVRPGRRTGSTRGTRCGLRRPPDLDVHHPLEGRTRLRQIGLLEGPDITQRTRGPRYRSGAPQRVHPRRHAIGARRPRAIPKGRAKTAISRPPPGTAQARGMPPIYWPLAVVENRRSNPSAAWSRENWIRPPASPRPRTRGAGGDRSVGHPEALS
jgi:hypothetical protein